ncbi:hypothetical protein QTP88_010772 [Uroleucon formosanum]
MWFLRTTKNTEVIDNALQEQVNNEINYWKNVLHRVVSTIQFLSERGLAFRGENENFGSKHNGNYLGCLELISKFDPFLGNHISNHGNKGREVIYSDKNQRPAVCHEAKSIYKKMSTLEFLFMLCMWYPILKRFEATSKALQLENFDLSNVISLYTSLKDYIEEIRNSFYTFLEEAKSLSGCETCLGIFKKKN